MAATLDARVETTDRLSPEDLHAVSALVEAATEADGLHPLSEHVMLHLRFGGEGPARHLLVFVSGDADPDAGDASGERLAGYAHLDPTDEVEGSSAEIVVQPALRHHGIGRLLVQSLEQASPDGRLRLWAHGQLPGARALASSLGYERGRELWQMRRSLYSPLPAVQLPEGLHLRDFRPGEDDEAWLAVNAAAFADHPEQGAWTSGDLHRRMAEPWFDPAGFLVLVDGDGAMAGFHWTKVHGGDHRDPAPDVPDGPAAPPAPEDPAADVPHAHEGHGHEPIGEVYVVGVAPGHQGQGLGRALTIAGLRHLRSLGLPQAMLYVDADNTTAIRTYTSLGFGRWDVDAMFSRPDQP